MMGLQMCKVSDLGSFIQYGMPSLGFRHTHLRAGGGAFKGRQPKGGEKGEERGERREIRG